MKVKEIMKQPYVTDKDLTFAEAAKIMSSKDIGSLLFVVKNEIKGMITEEELLKNFNKNGKISSVMTKEILTIDAEDDVDSALSVMREKNVRRAPVVEEGKLVGFITLTDIAAHADELGEDFFFG